MSIIEVMISIVALLISVTGASGYRYFSTLDIVKSDREITAGRTAMLLCASWKGLGGIETYNPLSDTSLGLDIQEPTGSLAPEVPPNFTTLGHYQVDSDNLSYYVTLSYYDVNSNLRILNTSIAWPASESQTNGTAMRMRSFRLSTLVTY